MCKWQRAVVAMLAAAVVPAAFGAIYNVPGDYPTIQGAILAALAGDEIIVAPGTYNESIFFNGHDITIRSSDGPAVTIIDGTSLTSPTVRIITGKGPASLFEGFTVIQTGTQSGTGILCDDTSPVISNCVVSGYDIGIALSGFAIDPTIIRCTLINNRTAIDGGSSSFAAPIIEWCLFKDNTSINFTIPGGINFVASVGNVQIRNCLFVGNRGPFYGAIRMADTTNPLFEITNCTFYGNETTHSASNSSGVGQINDGVFANCIAWNNGLEPITSSGQNLTVLHSNIEYGYPVSDFSIITDPLFVDPLNDDFRLSANSPCIDLGVNSWQPSVTDLDGNPRFVDDPSTADCPQPGADCGIAPIVDMGAYEFQVNPQEMCPWDLDDSGDVGIVDFLDLLAQWGTDPGGSPDFDGDGNVGITDFLALLAAWGPCP